MEELNDKIKREYQEIWKNRYSDREQYDRYKSVLGKNAPKTFDEFINLKYNDSEKCDSIHLNYKDETLKIAIKTKYNLSINEDRQSKQFFEHNKNVGIVFVDGKPVE